MQTLEHADIDRIVYGGHDGKITEVMGYQNYNITDDTIDPLNNPTALRPWVDTKIKSADFDRVFTQVNPASYVDFGSNLGYYVFRSVLEYGVPGVGIDYNNEYVSVCNSIKARHSIHNSSFINTNLQSWQLRDDTYDFMTVFNVIHHLYNRTEKYMAMEPLITDFANKARTILFEIPTEKDKKGHKWTMDTGYSEALFLSTASNIFTSVEKMPGQTLHRPYYLCVR